MPAGAPPGRRSRPSGRSRSWTTTSASGRPGERQHRRTAHRCGSSGLGQCRQGGVRRWSLADAGAVAHLASLTPWAARRPTSSNPALVGCARTQGQGCPDRRSRNRWRCCSVSLKQKTAPVTRSPPSLPNACTSRAATLLLLLGRGLALADDFRLGGLGRGRTGPRPATAATVWSGVEDRDPAGTTRSHVAVAETRGDGSDAAGIAVGKHSTCSSCTPGSASGLWATATGMPSSSGTLISMNRRN
jgi:hypothetical protein